jgi:riboflavin kinase/FMN adenylyltransferase
MPLPKTAQLLSLNAISEFLTGAVVAIGNFDGVHRGHQAVLAAARAAADRRGAPCLMLTLEPHPRAFFSGRPVFRLTPPSLKAAVAAAMGLDGTLVLPFDRALADQTAEDFVRKILVDRLHIVAAVTGSDFHFGKARRGTPDFLRQAGDEHGFEVTVIEPLLARESAVSSTRIRAALAAGEVRSANALLGWHFAVEGEVIHGDARGRDLGYPTANMALDPASEIAQGIYAVRFLQKDGALHSGVASYGRRPTFGGGPPLLESFLFDFSGDLYGEAALVALCGFIRSERKFETVEKLVAQMEEDSLDARALLEREPRGELDVRIAEAWARLGG